MKLRILVTIMTVLSAGRVSMAAEEPTPHIENVGYYQFLQGRYAPVRGEKGPATRCVFSAIHNFPRDYPLARSRAAALVNELEGALPPKEWQKFHETTLRLCKLLVQNESATKEAKEAEVIARKEYFRIERELGRYAKPSKSIVNYLSFTPLNGPISAKVGSDASFDVSLSPSIPTPLGSLTLFEATKHERGANMLVIAANGRRRYFQLGGAPFSLYIPAENGIRISSSEESLTIEIIDREAATHDRHPAGL